MLKVPVINDKALQHHSITDNNKNNNRHNIKQYLLALFIVCIKNSHAIHACARSVLLAPKGGQIWPNMGGRGSGDVDLAFGADLKAPPPQRLCISAVHGWSDQTRSQSKGKTGTQAIGRSHHGTKSVPSLAMGVVDSVLPVHP